MQQARNVFPIFLLLFVLSLIFFFFLQSPVSGPLQFITVPLQRAVYGISQKLPEDSSVMALKDENTKLRLQLAKVKETEDENVALRGQFALTSPAPKSLVPATVIGYRSDTMIIDKGQADNVQIGDVAVVKDNVIGSISKVSGHLAVITLISHPSSSFTARTAKTNASGVMHSLGSDSMYLDTVVLSDKLQKDDLVITKGDVSVDGKGFPPDLVVGKITSVTKKTSDLFQRAEVQSLIDFSQMRLVFIQRSSTK